MFLQQRIRISEVGVFGDILAILGVKIISNRFLRYKISFIVIIVCAGLIIDLDLLKIPRSLHPLPPAIRPLLPPQAKVIKRE